MVLRTLEMQGFKSFPDKTVLNFGKGITAVVGPNGSGKSNISDAVRWVLGETSTKSLRGSKMEDVIFGGTSARKALGFAQVQLTLDNSDGTLKDRGEIVTVTRRYYRSGESEYKIDGEQVRRKDIRELFMDTGLGADGYSLVGQGKIDSIISAKNEDRRELFEEAAGISRFRHKRTDAQRRLEQAQENLVRLLDILGELESRVGPLKVQSEKAAAFLDLSAEKKALEIGVWLQKLDRFTDELREQEHRIDAAGASYQICEADLAEIEKKIEEAAAGAAQLNVEIEEQRLASQKLEEEALRKDAEIRVLETNLQHQTETVERLEQEIRDADQTGATLEERLARLRQTIGDNDAAGADKRRQLEEITRQSQALLDSGDSNTKETTELNRKLSDLTLQLSDAKVQASAAASSMEEIGQRSGSVDDLLAACGKETQRILAQQQESQENLAFLQQRIDENSNALSGYQMKLQGKTAAAEKIKSKLDELAAAVQQKQQRANLLSDLEKNMEGFSGAVKAVIRQSRAGALRGIHGVLSQLITVEDAHSTAIEVALGAAMQNIVTDNEADAKRAMQYLKQNNAGRATFLPISNIQGRRLEERGLEDCFGYVALAPELVDCDRRYSQIISNLLGRTVIVEDLDSAIGMAKQYHNRFRIVTLDGQVMNPGGSMSGGSRAKGAGVLSRANQIEALHSEVKALEGQMHDVQAEYKTAVEEANFAAAKLQGAQADMKQAQEDLIRAQGDDKLICEKLSAAESQQQALQQEKDNAADRVQALQQDLDAANAKAAGFESAIADTRAALEQAGSQAAAITAQREETRRQTEQLNLDLVTLAKDSAAAKMSIEDLLARKNSAADRVAATRREIDQIRAAQTGFAAQTEQLQAEAGELRERAARAEEAVQQKIAARTDGEKTTGDLRAAERAKSQERQQLSAELVRLEERKNAMQKEYDELGDMLFEQYELTRREAQALNIQIDNMAEAKKRLHEIKVAIKKLGSINVGAIEEYKEVSERYTFLKEQIDDVERSKSELNKIIEDLTASMSEKFLTQFQKINTEFAACFTDFFGGGKGELIMEEPDNCLESAIEIKIQPPGKSVQNINLFSGGEKSLAALALLFSVLKVTPSPFCIYDEVEAALDDVNVERFAKYMRRMTDKTQFISITHRRGTMEEADVLYGVTMQEKGVSKLLELQTAELAAKMGLEE